MRYWCFWMAPFISGKKNSMCFFVSQISLGNHFANLIGFASIFFIDSYHIFQKLHVPLFISFSVFHFLAFYPFLLHSFARLTKCDRIISQCDRTFLFIVIELWYLPGNNTKRTQEIEFRMFQLSDCNDMHDTSHANIFFYISRVFFLLIISKERYIVDIEDKKHGRTKAMVA